ncbi:MAG: cysteine-rich CWC family protein [Betaproteobacteria bacterium]
MSGGAAATCPRCGAVFDCGALAGAEKCWCMERPPVEPVPGQGCRCPRCLDDVTDRLHRPA